MNLVTLEKKMSEEAAGNPAPDSGEEPGRGRGSCTQQCRTHRNTSMKKHCAEFIEIFVNAKFGGLFESSPFEL